MHSAKARKQPIHVVDLDPYGTAAPFIDAGVQVVTDDGAHRPPFHQDGYSCELGRLVMCNMHRSRCSGRYQLS
jgi:hypothetical protein